MNNIIEKVEELVNKINQMSFEDRINSGIDLKIEELKSECDELHKLCDVSEDNVNLK